MPTRTSKPAPRSTRAARPARPRASTAATAEPLEELEDDVEDDQPISGDVIDQSGFSVTPVRTLPARSTTRARRQAVEPEPERDDDDIETVDVDVTVRGYDYVFTVPAEMDDWPLDVLVAFEEGKAAVAVRGMLGTEQWRDLQIAKPRVGDLKSMFKVIAKAVGLGDQGE